MGRRGARRIWLLRLGLRALLHRSAVLFDWLDVSFGWFVGMKGKLTNRQTHGCGIIRLCRNQIHSNDRENVVINAKLEVRIAGDIHHTEPIRLPGRERGVETVPRLTRVTVIPKDIDAVDEGIVQHRRPDCLCSVPELVDCVDIPVGELYDAFIFVVVTTSRPVDDQTSVHALPGLQTYVRMVPCCAVLCCAPSIGHCISRWDGALRDGDYPVHGVCVVLAEAVDM